MYHRPNLRLVPAHEEARRLQINGKRACAEDLLGRLAHARVVGDGARIHLPCGQVVGQGNLDLRGPVYAGEYLRLPECRVLEVLAHGDDAQVIIAFAASAAAVFPARRSFLVIGVEVFGVYHDRAGCGHPQGADRVKSCQRG